MAAQQPKKHVIFRLTHVDNLDGILRRNGVCACNHTPNDGIQYRTIHYESVQATRSSKPVPCGPGGVIHDYVPFYFGPHSPMLYALHTGCVDGYDEGQEPLIYLVSSVEEIAAQNIRFVFTDGHGIVAYTRYFDDLTDLNQVAWRIVGNRYWGDTITSTVSRA